MTEPPRPDPYAAPGPDAKGLRVGTIATPWGGLVVLKTAERYWWAIETQSAPVWEPIPRSLYEELVAWAARAGRPEPLPGSPKFPDTPGGTPGDAASTGEAG